MDAIARALAGNPLAHFASLEAFWARHLEEAKGFDWPVDRAILGGALADRLGYAFAAGYAAALQALFPEVAPGTLASLAATEEGGAHPRAIATTLCDCGEGLRLTGHKKWVTLAGGTLFVLARTALTPEGRSELVVVRITRDRPGVTVIPQPPPPFAPEIVHAEILLDDAEVRPGEVLPGDGWQRWVKPFRTVEDLHVHAALLAYLLGSGARYGWPRELREKLAGLLVAARALCREDPSSSVVHLCLAGVLAQTRELVEAAEGWWDSAPAEVRERWRRDRSLLEVAARARAARTERAWSR